jgi:hypothetical protein
MKPCGGIEHLRQRALDERGVSFMTVMIITLMAGALGVAALTMTGLENSTAGAMRMVEEGTDAAESCVGMGVKVIKDSVDDGQVMPWLIAPNGPVPAANAVILGQEINVIRNSPDVAWGVGAAPNIVMNVNNYVVNGDIDLQFGKQRAGGQAEGQTPEMDMVYRIDCQAANAATGATSRVIAVYQCLKSGDSCLQRFL